MEILQMVVLGVVSALGGAALGRLWRVGFVSCVKNASDPVLGLLKELEGSPVVAVRNVQWGPSYRAVQGFGVMYLGGVELRVCTTPGNRRSRLPDLTQPCDCAGEVSKLEVPRRHAALAHRIADRAFAEYASARITDAVLLGGGRQGG